jgi:RNA polymerase sigma-70 factor (ECF subfamily)
LTDTAASKSGAVTDLRERRMSDADIVEGLLRGEPAAANALYEAYSAMIFRRVWRILGSDDEAEDVAQQIFAQVLGTIDKLENPDALGGWIARVAFGTIRKELRRRRYRRALFLESGSVIETAASADEETRFLTRRAFAVLERMKPEDRMVFVMYFIDGETHPEIAAAAGWSLSTAKRRVARARDVFLKKARRDSALAGLVEGDR